MTISTQKVNEIIEEAKKQAMIEIDESKPLLDSHGDRMTNHGVMSMFYKMKILLLQYEIGEEEKKAV